MRMGVGRFSGLSGALEFFRGQSPRREPPAQGPLLEDGAADPPGGAFRLSRHPNNLGPTLIVCLQPTMNFRLLTFAVVGSLYSYFGSRLEERRIAEAYADRYAAYKARTPYFFPLPWRTGS
jgi:steroid 5-alpha reductase family enzyme